MSAAGPVRAWLGLLPALALSAACFSTFPLDPSPQQPIDERLIGSWRCIPLSAGEGDVLHVQGADHEIFEREPPVSSAQARAILERVGESAFEDFALCVRAGRVTGVSRGSRPL